MLHNVKPYLFLGQLKWPNSTRLAEIIENKSSVDYVINCYLKGIYFVRKQDHIDMFILIVKCHVKVRIFEHISKSSVIYCS